MYNQNPVLCQGGECFSLPESMVNAVINTTSDDGARAEDHNTTNVVLTTGVKGQQTLIPYTQYTGNLKSLASKPGSVRGMVGLECNEMDRGSGNLSCVDAEGNKAPKMYCSLYNNTLKCQEDGSDLVFRVSRQWPQLQQPRGLSRDIDPQCGGKDYPCNVPFGPITRCCEGLTCTPMSKDDDDYFSCK